MKQEKVLLLERNHSVNQILLALNYANILVPLGLYCHFRRIMFQHGRKKVDAES